MPNTLAHVAVQAAATRLVAPAADLKWLLLGAVLPDLPWIAERLARPWWPEADAYDLRLYFSVQASLLFCVALGAAFALLSQRPRAVFALLSANALLHLLLDAGECKWGNGVHLLAPWSWATLNVGVAWPESPLVLGLTAGGLAYLVWLAGFRPGTPVGLAAHSRGRVLTAAGLILGYLVLPLPFRPAVEAADSYAIATLRHPEQRAGRAVAFDRAELRVDAQGAWVRTLAGETIRVTGEQPLPAGTVSLRGRFGDDGAIQVSEVHHHEPWLRDGPTYVGLAAFAAVWAIALVGAWRRRTASAAPDNAFQEGDAP